jgi:hypothetical protein
MATEVQRSRGRPSNYKFDRGGVPAEFGPFYGVVKNTTDSIRSGRIQVYIDAFSNGGENEPSKWITVSYMPQFFGSTPYNPAKTGVGSYIDGNSNSYGMWFTPPDVGITVLCVFVNGDRSQGFYIGTAPDQSIGHMVPAIGAAPVATQVIAENANQSAYFQGASQLPVVEINTNNIALEENARFFDAPKPIQSVVAETMFRQGLIKDPQRGPISSSSQRESPSAVFGVSTPGPAVYAGGMKLGEIQRKVQTGELKPQDLNVIGRVGGHSIVMDDGDTDGNTRLIRFRTTAGHQITMSDSGDFFYITHANGLAWFELGAQGTLDVYATNSINLRTRGDINLHADRDINMYAGGSIKAKAVEDITLQADADFTAIAQQNLKLYSKSYVGIKADGSLALQSATGSWDGGSTLTFTAGGIDLNGPAADSVSAPNNLTTTILDDTTFSSATGWAVETDGLESIVTRAPTHEPYPYHNKGVDIEIPLEAGQPPPNPGAVPVPAGFEFTRKA